MRTDKRIPRFASWITLACFVASIAAWVFSVKVCYAYVWTRSELRISDGQLQYDSGIYDGAPGWHRFAVINDIGLHLPKLRFRGTGVEFIVPFWIPSLIFGCGSHFWYSLHRRLRRRQALGQCESCGYDLTANQSNKCPECGTATPLGSAVPISPPENS